MIRAATPVQVSIVASVIAKPCGVMPETETCPVEVPRIRRITNGIKRTKRVAPTRRRKIRTRHPARMPLGPRKKVWAGGEIRSVSDIICLDRWIELGTI
jgi:hypothetical protein